MVAALIAERMGRIRQICREYWVERLYLFGSVANGEMRPDSDVDFLVEFQEGAQEHFGPGLLGSPLLRLGVELDGLFDREVDLVDPRLVVDVEFLQEIEETKKLIYEAGNPSLKRTPPRPPRTQREKEKTLNRRIRNYLRDIYQAAQAVRRFAMGRTEEDYLADRMLRSAIEREMTVICEAMRELDRTAPEITARFTGYRDIIRFRTFLVHLYMEIDDEKAWGFVEEDIPTVAAEAEDLLNELGWPPER